MKDDNYEEFLDDLDEMVTEAIYEEPLETIESLKQWQAAALKVLDEWDEFYVAIGSPGKVGDAKTEGALRYVQHLQKLLGFTDPEFVKASLDFFKNLEAITSDRERWSNEQKELSNVNTSDGIDTFSGESD